MKSILTCLTSALLFISCMSNHSEKSVQGTWKLISGTLIEGNDTTVTDYTKDVSFIKVINETHFAFMQHDLNRGQDSGAVYVSGGGRYTVRDNSYTEHLEYCSARNWEGNDFTFTIRINGDSLIQTGIEKIDSLGINRFNIEKYVKLN